MSIVNSSNKNGVFNSIKTRSNLFYPCEEEILSCPS